MWNRSCDESTKITERGNTKPTARDQKHYCEIATFIAKEHKGYCEGTRKLLREGMQNLLQRNQTFIARDCNIYCKRMKNLLQ